MNEQIIRLQPDEELIIRKIVKEDYSFAEFCGIAKISRSKLYRLRQNNVITVNGKRINHSELEKLKK